MPVRLRLAAAGLLATALSAGEVPVLRLATGHGGVTQAVAVAGGAMRLTTGEDGTTRLWDVLRRREVRRWEGLSGVIHLAPDGRRALVCGAVAAVIGLEDGQRGPDLLFAWHRSGNEAIERPLRLPAEAALWLPDGSAVLVCGSTGMRSDTVSSVSCWRGDERPPADDAGWILFDAIHHLAGQGDGRITGAVHAQARSGLERHRQALADAGDAMRYADTDDELLNAIPRWNAPGTLAGLSADGRVALVDAPDGVRRAYQVDDGAEVLPAPAIGRRLPQPVGPVDAAEPATAPFLAPTQVELSPDGRRCLAVQPGRGWAIFELASGRWLAGGPDGASAPRRFADDGSPQPAPPAMPGITPEEANVAGTVAGRGGWELTYAYHRTASGGDDGDGWLMLRGAGGAAVDLRLHSVLRQELDPHLRAFIPIAADRAAGRLAVVAEVRGAIETWQQLVVLDERPLPGIGAVWPGRWEGQAGSAAVAGWARLSPDGTRVLYAPQADPRLLAEQAVGEVGLAMWHGPAYEGDTGSRLHLRRPEAGEPVPPADARRIVVPGLAGAPELHPGHDRAVVDAAWGRDGSLAVSAAADATIGVWVREGGGLRLAYRWAGDPRGAWVAMLPDGDYAGSREALPWVYRLEGSAVIPFEQFDLLANRPDRVLESMPGADARLVAACRAARFKRLRAMGVDPAAAPRRDDLPTASADLAAVPPRTVARSLRVRVRANAAAGLVALDARIDAVPVATVPLQGSSAEAVVELPLAAGDNHVELSVRDRGGRLSRPETFTIACDAPAPPRRLVIACLGVSAYTGGLEPLAYAAKDAVDLAAALAAGNAAVAAVEPLVLTDAAVDRAGLERVRQHLAQASVDDIALLFVAGHGLLDRDLAYWYATAATAADDPARGGISFSDLEGALAATPARDRLLLMDTCHAGEVDDSAGSAAVAPQVRVATRGLKRGGIGEDEAFRLMRELFVDLRRGTGAVAITASAGAEYAEESGELRNGVFTASVIRSIRAAPRDGLRAGALRTEVARRVAELTAGRQTPTSRRDNLLRDPLLYRPR